MRESELSRRWLLQSFVTAAGTMAALAVEAQQAAAQVKASKTIVAYQDQPKGNQSCENCIHFQPPSACEAVEGDVTSHGWCRAYAPKG